MRRISLKNCPYCDCSEVYISTSTNIWQKMSSLLLLRLLRCDLCKRRHYRPMFLAAAVNPARNISPKKGAQTVAIKKKKQHPA